MNWKKYIFLVIFIVSISQVFFIGDIYINSGKKLNIEKVNDGKYKINLYLRSFYIYSNSINKSNFEPKNFKIEKFPEKSFADGLNYGNNVGGLTSWSDLKSEELGLNSNSIIIPYDAKLFLFFNIHRDIVITIETYKKDEPTTLTYFW